MNMIYMFTTHVLGATSFGYSAVFLDLFVVLCLFSGIFIIVTKNPIISVLYLILLFSFISCYLIFIGIKFIGISYLLVYAAAVSILFLFILMLINIRVSELSSDTNNNVDIKSILCALFAGLMYLITIFLLGISCRRIIYQGLGVNVFIEWYEPISIYYYIVFAFFSVAAKIYIKNRLFLFVFSLILSLFSIVVYPFNLGQAILLVKESFYELAYAFALLIAKSLESYLEGDIMATHFFSNQDTRPSRPGQVFTWTGPRPGTVDVGTNTYRGGWRLTIENNRIITRVPDISNVSREGFNVVIETYQPYGRIFADGLSHRNQVGFGGRLDFLSTRDGEFLRQLCAVYNQPCANSPWLRQTLRNLP